MSESQKLKVKSQKVNCRLPTSDSRLPISLSSIVLAGGKSSRMGRDKALLPVDGVPLLQKVCEVAVALCDRVYVVTPWQERYQHLLPIGCEFIREQGGEESWGSWGGWGGWGSWGRKKPTSDSRLPTPDSQLSNSQSTINTPLTGFAQGLIHVETEWVLLLACDLPCLRLEVLQDWANELEGIPEEAIALLPRHPKGWEPLCGFYRRSCLNVLESYIEQGGRSFQRWLAQYPVQPLSHFEPSILFNCNTPADYATVSQGD
ncbi:molybdenum cofactor guanylyltransferase [cyanobacterium TDX16]|nr:molybdenum cofactor guanylyltransferase [cyanobacterium TDX16]